MCIDYCTLNTNTKLDIFSLPYTTYFLDKLGKEKYFSSIDLPITYYYIRLAKGDTHKTSFFLTKSLYVYNIMLFKLCYAPETFLNIYQISVCWSYY